MKHEGGCQCGAVRYQVNVELDNTITCNCSRCQKMGFVLAFAPQEKFNLLSGEDVLTEYLFNKQIIRHLFCSVCGVESFALAQAPDGTPTVAVNVNCLDNVEPRSLRSEHFDGRSV